MRLRLLLATALCLQTSALASLETVSQQLLSATGGIAQTCPSTYSQAVCGRADGSVIQTVRLIDKTFPTLLPTLWRDGPENGLSADMPQENAVLHLIPRTEGQTLMILQPKGTAAPAVSTSLPASGAVTIENPEQAYIVVLDDTNRPVKDLSSVQEGTYTVVYSAYGRKTQTQQLKIGGEGLRKLTAPRLAAATASSTAGGLVLPTAPNYIFLVYTAGGVLVTDISDLRPGYYDVFSYLDGAAGPLAGSQTVVSGQTTRLQFNGTFAGAPTTTPTVIPSSTISVPSYQPAATPSSSGGQCYVNGYRRSNGTYVSGYYRRC